MNAPFHGKRELVLQLDSELVERAERLGPDLSATVERLLRRHLPVSPPTQQDIDAHCAASNAFIEEHGFWGEEFRSL